ncbi:putative protein-disulfide isomerase [Paucibacter oligotrophus]|uniref:DSBA-like thioredoxin domain-containing protein n=1 Tax=Roseateles oligotrophus TaxID=1769250 RepID=A0A840L8S4_9BURK|nr:DsbA family protein [Roseateles oligotrophus]MBB4843072.1 putative protein-disulfide isomerase [Roseateles oligotrophus]
MVNQLPATLHYIYDPMCGWCYGAAPLVQAAAQLPGLTLQLHGGGMFAGSARRPVTPELQAYVAPHDRRIAALSGQPFGSAYTEGLLKDLGAVLDSGPPITAILAAQQLGGAQQGLAMLGRIQQAHYVQGRRVAEAEVLQTLALAQGLEAEAFATAFQALSGPATLAHLAASRQLMQAARVQGFPNLVLERADGRLQSLELSRFHGQPAPWADYLRGTLQADVTPA